MRHHEFHLYQKEKHNLIRMYFLLIMYVYAVFVYMFSYLGEFN